MLVRKESWLVLLSSFLIVTPASAHECDGKNKFLELQEAHRQARLIKYKCTSSEFEYQLTDKNEDAAAIDKIVKDKIAALENISMNAGAKKFVQNAKYLTVQNIMPPNQASANNTSKETFEYKLNVRFSVHPNENVLKIQKILEENGMRTSLSVNEMVLPECEPNQDAIKLEN
jgi:histone deacetylase complex regulatory component SIN3